MYSEKNNQDMWWVEGINEKKDNSYCYGPFFHKRNAQKFLDNEL